MALFDKFFKRGQPVPEESAPDPQPPEQPQQAARGTLPFDVWMAVKGATAQEISRVVAMHDTAVCDWDTGMRMLDQQPGRVFVTDQAEGFHFIISKALPNLAYRARAGVWLEQLGAHFEAVYYFAACPEVDVYYFAMVEGGQVRRIYAVAQGELKVNKGGVSQAEQALGLRLPVNDDELFEGAGVTRPSAAVIAALAGACSAKPTAAVGCDGVLGRIDRQ